MKRKASHSSARTTRQQHNLSPLVGRTCPRISATRSIAERGCSYSREQHELLLEPRHNTCITLKAWCTHRYSNFVRPANNPAGTIFNSGPSRPLDRGIATTNGISDQNKPISQSPPNDYYCASTSPVQCSNCTLGHSTASSKFMTKSTERNRYASPQ